MGIEFYIFQVAEHEFVVHFAIKLIGDWLLVEACLCGIGKFQLG